MLVSEVSRADRWEQMIGLKCGRTGNILPVSSAGLWEDSLEPVSASHPQASSFDDEGSVQDDPVSLDTGLNKHLIQE